MDAFLTSLLLVALAEIGDKTPLLAFVLAARLRKPLPISAGIFVATVANHPTLGMMLADVPAVIIGEKLARKLPLKALRWAATSVFILIGVVTPFKGPGITF